MVNSQVHHVDFGYGEILHVYKTNKTFSPNMQDVYVIQFQNGPRVGLFRKDFKLVRNSK